MSWCDNLSISTWLISWDTNNLTVFISCTSCTTNEGGIYFTPNYVAKLPIKLNSAYCIFTFVLIQTIEKFSKKGFVKFEIFLNIIEKVSVYSQL